MLDRIRDIHRTSRGTYGAPRIHAELVAQGHAVGRKRIARLMRRAGLRGISRRKGTRTTVRDARARAVPDLVERDFTADAPDRLWVADITYIPTWAGFLYLAVVLDASNGDMALWQTACVHHSDQGSQYTSLAFGKRCRDAGVRPSTGSVGDCYDNAMCESFFATLECELLGPVSCRSADSSSSSRAGTIHDGEPSDISHPRKEPATPRSTITVQMRHPSQLRARECCIVACRETALSVVCRSPWSRPARPRVRRARAR